MAILGMLGGAALGALGGIIGNSQKKREAERQHKRQQELMDKQQGQSKEMYDYTQAGNKEMYDYQLSRTNAKAQMSEMKQAGLNPALMYGMGGEGGAGSGSMGAGSSATGSAPTASKADVQNITAPMDMAQMMLMKAQKENIEANTENTKADTAKKSGVDTEQAEQNVRATTFANDVNEMVTVAKQANKGSAEVEIQETMAQMMDAEWQQFKGVGFGKREFGDPEALANKAMKAGFEKAILEIKDIQARINNTNANTSRTKIQSIIDNYKANLAEEGINPESPAIVKGIIDALIKMGNPSEFKDKVNNKVKEVFK